MVRLSKDKQIQSNEQKKVHKIPPASARNRKKDFGKLGHDTGWFCASSLSTGWKLTGWWIADSEARVSRRLAAWWLTTSGAGAGRGL